MPSEFDLSPPYLPGHNKLAETWRNECYMGSLCSLKFRTIFIEKKGQKTIRNRCSKATCYFDDAFEVNQTFDNFGLISC